MTRRHLAAALLACGALASTIAGRLLGCEGCDYAIFGIPLFAAGSAFYLGLGLLALFGRSLRVIGWISLPAVAVQAGLVRFLFTVGVPCVTCIVSASLLFALSILCLAPEQRWRFAPGAAAVIGTLALPLWSGLLVEIEAPAGMPEFVRASDLRSPPEGATFLVVYERETCSFCKSFRKDYEPRLAQDFGSTLVIRRIDAKDRGLRRLPTFLIRSPGGSTFVVRGLPTYEKLADQVRAAR